MSLLLSNQKLENTEGVKKKKKQQITPGRGQNNNYNNTKRSFCQWKLVLQPSNLSVINRGYCCVCVYSWSSADLRPAGGVWVEEDTTAIIYHFIIGGGQARWMMKLKLWRRVEWRHGSGSGSDSGSDPGNSAPVLVPVPALAPVPVLAPVPAPAPVPVPVLAPAMAPVLAPRQTPQPSISVNNREWMKVIHFNHTPACPPSRCPRGLLYLSTFFISSPFFCPGWWQSNCFVECLPLKIQTTEGDIYTMEQSVLYLTLFSVIVKKLNHTTCY